MGFLGFGTSPEEIFNKAYSAYEKGDYKKALSLFEKAAAHGLDTAQYNCGLMYECGMGTEQNDSTAIQWYKKAKMNGHDFGDMNELSDTQFIAIATPEQLYEKGMELYESADGVTELEFSALKYLEPAAKSGNLDAQFECGQIYFQVDDEKSLYWLKEAASKGHMDAQCTLGTRYQYGYGTARNLEEAKQWYRKAAEQGHKFAINALKSME